MIFASTIVAVFTFVECRSAHRSPSQVVARQPSSNVCWAVAKHDAPTGFMLAEKADGLAIGQDQVCNVKHHLTPARYLSSFNVASASSASTPPLMSVISSRSWTTRKGRQTILRYSTSLVMRLPLAGDPATIDSTPT